MHRSGDRTSWGLNSDQKNTGDSIGNNDGQCEWVDWTDRTSIDEFDGFFDYVLSTIGKLIFEIPLRMLIGRG